MTKPRPPRRSERPRMDLPLAPLQSFTAAEFFRADNQDLAEFMLMAALVFNDLIDVAKAEEAVLKTDPSGVPTRTNPDREEQATHAPSVPTPELGQYAGRRVHIQRVMLALLNEAMELVAKHGHLFESEQFKSCVKRMPGFAREAWNAVVAAAQGHGPDQKADRTLRAVLAKVRANVAFHYYQPRGLGSGMSEFAADGIVKAYVSLGRNGESSRYYFADAAAQRFVDSALKASVLEYAFLVEQVVNVADAFRLLVEAYLRERRLL